MRPSISRMFGNRGIYHEGWTCGHAGTTRRGCSWAGATNPAFDDDVWELYDTSKDWSQARDLSKEMPEKLHELQRLWLIEATRYNVLPLDDRGIERARPEVAGRPILIKGTSQILFAGMGRLSENSVINIKNKIPLDHRHEIVVPTSGVEGVIVAQGGNIGGWSLYAKGGKLKYCYNLLGVQYFYAESASALPAGEHQVRMEFAYAGGGLAKGGQVSLYVDGKKVGEGQVGATAPMIFSADDGCDVGEDTGAPVSPDYGPRGKSAFTGRVKGVQIAVAAAAESSDHLVSPEEALPDRDGEAITDPMREQGSFPALSSFYRTYRPNSGRGMNPKTHACGGRLGPYSTETMLRPSSRMRVTSTCSAAWSTMRPEGTAPPIGTGVVSDSWDDMAQTRPSPSWTRITHGTTLRSASIRLPPVPPTSRCEARSNLRDDLAWRALMT